MTQGVDIVGRRTLDRLIESAARGREQATFVVLADGRTVGYGAFLAMRAAAESILRAHGVRPGDAVLVHMPTSLRQVALMFGLYRMGAVAAMSNPVNTAREVGAIVRRSGARLLVVDDDGAELAAAMRRDGHAVLAASAFDRVLDAEAVPVPPSEDAAALTPESPATMIFTSGTTSEPKCVVYRHGHQVFGAECYAYRMGLDRGSMLMHHFPLFHMNGLNQLAATVLSGARLLLLERFRSGLFDEYLDTFAPTVTYLNATHIKMVRETGTTLRKPNPLRCVGMALQMGDSDYDWFEAKYGPILSEGYGLTESISACLGNPSTGAKRASCGLPILGYEARLVAEDGSVCAPGQTGELHVRCQSRWGLFHGYEGDPEATAKTLVDGWLHTGDILRSDEDGYLYFVDRAKDIIKRAGENISAREVEKTLETHPGILEAAVVGRPDRLREEVPVAFVVPRTRPLDVDAVMAFCRERLAPHKLPAALSVVDSLPKTAVGKIEKKVLRQWLQDDAAAAPAATNGGAR
jgi:crotonobetaine/carnitine-CoA ligase